MKVIDILKRESVCTSNVYLYEENGQWCAYEHSANLLSKLFGSKITLKQAVYDMFLLNKAEVELQELNGVRIVSCSDNELILSLSF